MNAILSPTPSLASSISLRLAPITDDDSREMLKARKYVKNVHSLVDDGGKDFRLLLRSALMWRTLIPFES